MVKAHGAVWSERHEHALHSASDQVTRGESGGPWLLGKTITLADVAVMPALVRMADLGLDHMWKDIPRIGRWYDEIRAHAAFKPTYYVGSLLTEKFPHLRERAAKPN